MSNVITTENITGQRPQKQIPMATCPKCHKRFRVFENYMSNQEVCPACEDESLAPSRERAQRPERIAAAQKLKEIEKTDAQKKQEQTAETVKTIAETLKELGIVKAKA